jgi:hypothetical protein
VGSHVPVNIVRLSKPSINRQAAHTVLHNFFFDDFMFGSLG